MSIHHPLWVPFDVNLQTTHQSDFNFKRNYTNRVSHLHSGLRARYYWNPNISFVGGKAKTVSHIKPCLRTYVTKEVWIHENLHGVQWMILSWSTGFCVKPDSKMWVKHEIGRLWRLKNLQPLIRCNLFVEGSTWIAWRWGSIWLMQGTHVRF